AIKSAVSDGIKRALRAWGDQFGLRLYEHDINESTSSQDNTSSDNEFEIPDNVTKDTIRESIKFAYNRPWVDQENPESITDKQRGKIKGFLSNINLSDEEQHKFLQKITGRSIDSTTDMYKYEANGFLHLLFNANDKLKSIFNNNNNSSNDEDKNEMDYIVELSEKLDEHDIKKQALLDWLNEKADTEIDTLDDIPKAWLERMIGDGFWNKNKDDIMRSDKEKLVKRVKDKLDDKDIEYEAQLYKWYSEQEDEDYEKLSDLETGQLKQVLEEEFWEENYKEIDEVVPF
ncbi:MAG: RAD52 family DNA repair protein, partial [Clostridiales bacterium]|nr:RAD52 family DNA repair protein [Clostridiales bacterium]